MYADKSQWFVFILFGVISVVGINVLLAQRDIRSFKEYERLEQMNKLEEQAVYRQLEVIPFANSQWTDPIFHPYLTLKNTNLW